MVLAVLLVAGTCAYFGWRDSEGHVGGVARLDGYYYYVYLRSLQVGGDIDFGDDLVLRLRPGELHLLRQVMNGVRRERALRGTRALVSENMRLLSRRIAERNAETGEHYIATTRAQYRTMLGISLGGGALMTFAVYIKFGITADDLKSMVYAYPTLSSALPYTLG